MRFSKQNPDAPTFGGDPLGLAENPSGPVPDPGVDPLSAAIGDPSVIPDDPGGLPNHNRHGGIVPTGHQQITPIVPIPGGGEGGGGTGANITLPNLPPPPVPITGTDDNAPPIPDNSSSTGLPLAMPGGLGGSFAQPGSEGSVPFRPPGFFADRASGPNHPTRVGPGSTITAHGSAAGGDALGGGSALDDLLGSGGSDADLLKQILGGR